MGSVETSKDLRHDPLKTDFDTRQVGQIFQSLASTCPLKEDKEAENYMKNQNENISKIIKTLFASFALLKLITSCS